MPDTEEQETARLRLVVKLGAYVAELTGGDNDEGAEIFALIVDDAVGVAAAE
jgi:hypothetical protein